MGRAVCYPPRGLLLLLAVLWSAEGGKLLVVPMDGSHWLSMKILAEELGQRGHEVVVLTPEVNMVIKGSALYKTMMFEVPYSKEELAGILGGLKDSIFHNGSHQEGLLINIDRIQALQVFQARSCKSLLYNSKLMAQLERKEFDALLTDPFLPCGVIIAEKLAVPAVFFLRGMPCGMDRMAAQCPSPPSFVPRDFTVNTDHMTFPQRVQNLLSALWQPLLCRMIFSSFDELASRYLQRDISFQELMSHGVVWLLRYDFTFEYPRPLMPNMVLIGGINCRVKKGLPVELEEFVNSSGEHGFVVFTLGSMISEMPLEKVNQFAEALGKIPQKVIWRLTGPTPGNLSANIKLMKWLPQNDLLAHPKARVFMTHGGTHGIYEGICNAIPMVMLPLFGDQADNVLRVASQGAGVVLNIHDMTSQSLLDALNTVINDTSYKENMMRLSEVHKDRPIEPLDLAVHWTEFVMRHKGAEHLRPAAHDLNWIQYHCLDVIGLLVVIVIAVTLVTVKSCAFCFRKCCRRSGKKRKTD
ncbi:UDP-glucuronosyltransferase 1-2-like [Polyodon spathula]|uniref:UDP-glucuronosyltransferase 1-2-like n=1 Tax=Polyodon spathula TaxID=7913 RepID=UPI001B7ED84F|nr:UDP-glucuronosyltransferase 1-2-like [Polyodon spathula]